MANALLDRERSDPAQTRDDTFEGNIFKDVIRESWKERVAQKRTGSELMSELDEHAVSMRKLLNTYDYEIASMPVVVANSAHMNRAERREYLSNLEAIAIGYGNLLGPELTNIIMLGLPRKAKDNRAVSRYTSLLLKELEKRHGACSRRVSVEGRAAERATARLIAHGSSIFRFFRRRRIATLKRVVERRSSRIKKLETRAQRYAYLLERVKERSSKE